MNLDDLSAWTNFEFHHPWLLLLAVPALALVVWNHARRGSVPSLVYPSVARFKGMPRTLRQRALVLIPVFQALAVLLLVAAAARPRTGDSTTVVRSEGIAIQMVLDRSGSMEAEMNFGGRERRRIDIVKEVFSDFVAGDGELEGRKTDLIGLTTFARFTEESCPLVSQHEPLLTAVKNLRTVEPYVDMYNQPTRKRENARANNPLNATAIGDGLMRAVYSLVAAEEDLFRGDEKAPAATTPQAEEAPVVEVDEGYKIKGKVIILLTDGENNAGEVDPEEAGRYARENGIRLYYIVLTEPLRYQETFFGRRVVGELSPDEILAVPRKITGDPERAFLARDGNALRKIYEEIDRLERSEIGRFEYRSYHEKFHFFLLPGFALAVLAMLLGETWLRRIP